jgi:hypothetical protein
MSRVGSRADNDPLNKTDPLGLSPQDCNFNWLGCRYVVNDLVNSGWSAGDNPGDDDDSWWELDRCYDAGAYRSEAYEAAQAGGLDPRFVYAIYAQETTSCRSNAQDQALDAVGALDSAGPMNLHQDHWNRFADRHGIPGFFFGSLGSDRNARFGAFATVDVLLFLNDRLDDVLDDEDIDTIRPDQVRAKLNDGGYIYHRTSLLGVMWVAGDRPRSTVRAFLNRMPDTITNNDGLWNAAANRHCYINSFTVQTGALGGDSSVAC